MTETVTLEVAERADVIVREPGGRGRDQVLSGASGRSSTRAKRWLSTTTQITLSWG
jgi:hypothetical protein